MRKITKLIMLFTTMLLISTTVFANNEMNVVIEDKSVNFNRTHNGQPLGKPYIENGRTYIPLRIISEDLGYEVSWNQKERTATIKEKGTTVKIKIGQTTALVNGVKKNIDVDEKGNVQDTKAVIKNNRTYVPVRFVAEAMGERVEYRQPSNSSVKQRTVYINSINLPEEEKKEEKPVQKPSPSGIVPRFTLVPHTKAGSMDYDIFLNNFKEYEGTGAKFSPELVSHPQYNSYVVRGNVQKDANKMMANKEPIYYQSTFRLTMWNINSNYKDINTGKSLTPPKVGEIMKWHITIDMDGKPSEVYEIKIPYRGFTNVIYTDGTTNGTRIK